MRFVFGIRAALQTPHDTTVRPRLWQLIRANCLRAITYIDEHEASFFRFTVLLQFVSSLWWMAHTYDGIKICFTLVCFGINVLKHYQFQFCSAKYKCVCSACWIIQRKSRFIWFIILFVFKTSLVRPLLWTMVRFKWHFSACVNSATVQNCCFWFEVRYVNDLVIWNNSILLVYHTICF